MHDKLAGHFIISTVHRVVGVVDNISNSINVTPHVNRMQCRIMNIDTLCQCNSYNIEYSYRHFMHVLCNSYNIEYSYRHFMHVLCNSYNIEYS